MRDRDFDNADFFSGGIRLFYKSCNKPVEGLKEGILLEVGFDDVTPNIARDISSWAYDYAADKVEIIDNRAKAVACYDPGYTLVEKLQTISTKFRRQQETGNSLSISCATITTSIACSSALRFRPSSAQTPIRGTKKSDSGAGDNPNIAANEAFVLSDPQTRETYKAALREPARSITRPANVRRNPR